MARPQLKISVPQPCSESWAEMSPQAAGRFCTSCATTVVDFSQFTDKQLLEYFTRQSGKTCGRFSANQLDRAVYAEVLSKQNFFPRTLAAVALFLGISSQTQGQNIPDQPVPSSYIQTDKNAAAEKTVVKAPEKVRGDSLVLSGRVLDSKTKEPIPFGNVAIKNTNIYSSTDLKGEFKLIVPDTFQLEEFTLFMPNVGYMAGEFLINRSDLPKEQVFELVGDYSSMTTGIVVYSRTEYFFRSIWWRTKSLFWKND